MNFFPRCFIRDYFVNFFLLFVTQEFHDIDVTHAKLNVFEKSLQQIGERLIEHNKDSAGIYGFGGEINGKVCTKFESILTQIF